MAKLSNVDSTVHEAERLVDADEAARVLGVRKQTLYAYVSRGVLRSYGGARSKGSRYLAVDVARLKARSGARAGHTAVAAGALRWGEPVLDSSITAIGARGPLYRGHAAIDLARRGVKLEAVAELLWTSSLPEAPPLWTPLHVPSTELHRAKRGGTGEPGDLVALTARLSRAALMDETRHQAPRDAELARARSVLAWLASSGARTHARASFAERVAGSIGVAAASRSSARVVAALDMMLVLMADHELNASSFGARVAASTGADLYACLIAALAVASGPLHGGAPARVEALLDEIGEPARARDVVEARTRRGEGIPGFDHPLYPKGDPRAAPMLDLASTLSPRSRRVRTALALCETMKRARRQHPNTDLALVAACDAIGAARGSASRVFVLGRTAGWVAHVLEQREAGYGLRPRARYVGPAPIAALE